MDADAVRRLVLDLLKPHEPDVVRIARAVVATPGVDGVNATLLETDREVQNVKLTIEGNDVQPERVEATIEDLGGTVHSIDQVVVGSTITEEAETAQDVR